MTKEELIHRLTDIEWDDFEVKEAKSELPKNVWETVCAFSNTSGGWIVLGASQHGKQFEITGVENADKLDNDFTGVLRSQTKFNAVIPFYGKKLTMDGHTLLLYKIESSPLKPIYFNNNLLNVFVRKGQGDQRATDMEIAAMQRDQAFGTKSEQAIERSSFADIDRDSLSTYRVYLQGFNASFLYNDLADEDFCEKLRITQDGHLTYAGLLMFGKRDIVQKYVPTFWVDLIEIPGNSYADASSRYTFRMPEQANVWESYRAIIQRLRLHVDAPFTAGPDGFAPDDESQLYALREGFVNMLVHADYFSPMHSTIRIYDNRIELQNAGRFMIDMNHLRDRIQSAPRNPSLVKFFRYAKLSENAGYGIDKMIRWEQLTSQPVTFDTDIYSGTVTYWRPQIGSDRSDRNRGLSPIREFGSNQVGTKSTTKLATKSTTKLTTKSVTDEQKKILLCCLEPRTAREALISIEKAFHTDNKKRYLVPLIDIGFLSMTIPDRPNSRLQRYETTPLGRSFLEKDYWNDGQGN